MTSISTALGRVATASEPELRHITSNLAVWLDNLGPLLDSLPREERIFTDDAAFFRVLADGPQSIPEFRRQELAMIAEGEQLLHENNEIADRLTAAVDRLIQNSRTETAEPRPTLRPRSGAAAACLSPSSALACSAPC
jgi:hypothetical protein